MRISKKQYTLIIGCVTLMIVLAAAIWFAQDRLLPYRWLPVIRAFEKEDCDHPPPAGATLFVGSSSIRRWDTLAEDFPLLHVIKRGFGGAKLLDLIVYARRIIIPYQPRQIVIYAGDNDISSDKRPETVYANFVELVTLIREELPAASIFFLAIKPSPQRWHKAEAMRQANSLIRQYTQPRENVTFVDIFSPMLGLDQTPRPELYHKDGLHLSGAGYAVWTEVLTPHLK